mgnify:CR=1 FL=1
MSLHVTEKDHILGPAEAPIEIVEYADYQCPYCKKAFYIMQDILKEQGDNIRFVFRNFPLEEVHPYALHAAIAAEAASGQGKFWEMHDILLENQRELDDAHLIEYARIIDMDVEKFRHDFSLESYVRKVQEDYASGEKNGVDSTPTFFVNGRKYEGNWTTAEFPEYLRSLLP